MNLSHLEQKNDKRVIDKITYNDEILYDTIESARQTSNICMISGISGTLILLPIGIYLIKHQQSNKAVSVNSIHFNVSNEFLSVFEKNKKYSCVRNKKKMLIYGICFFASIEAIVFCAISFLEILACNLLVQILVPMIILAISILFLVLYLKSLPTINRKKYVKSFVEDYKKYFESSKDTFSEYISDEGIKVCLIETLDDEMIDQYYQDGREDELDQEVTIPFDGLNLYISVAYTKQHEMAKIYVCSDVLPNSGLHDDIVNILSVETYNSLKKYNVKIRGLDYLLDHFEAEIIKNTTKEKFKEAKNNCLANVVVDYKQE